MLLYLLSLLLPILLMAAPALPAGEIAVFPLHSEKIRGAETRVNESAREIPIVRDVDVVVVGGSTGAVAAASEAARSGAKVFLAAPRQYLGEDVCGAMRFWPEADKAPIKPMEVKRRLDEALLAAGVEFLYGCQPTDVLRDGAGSLAGIVMANRNGRQAVRAKVIIDATARGTVARLAGARFRPYPAGKQAFRWVVAGGSARPSEDCVVRELEGQFAGETAYEYTLKIPMADGSFPSIAAAEQVARDKTFHPGQIDASESLFQVPPDPMHGESTFSGGNHPDTAWPGAEKIDLGVFRPAGVARLYVLGGCADMDRDSAERLLRPEELRDAGARIGKAAAEETRRAPRAGPVAGAGDPPDPSAAPGDVAELLSGIRSTQRGLTAAWSAARTLPVWGKYDVVIAGGGTSGAPAAISAARQGARTLVVEYQPALGGVGTIGGINNYWHGHRVGFFHEVEKGVAAIGAKVRGLGKAEYWRRECRKAGAEVWLGALVCGAVVEGGEVRGIIVATPGGRGAVLAKVVIDATGNADVAAAAGAECMLPGGNDLTMQMAGVPFRTPADLNCNSAFTFADDTDMVDLWQSFVCARERWKDAHDLGQLVQTRARRSIVGEVVLTPVDQHAGRTFSDTLVLCHSNYDKYNMPVHPLYLARSPDKGLMVWSRVPYRSLLPKGLDGILVIGLGKSADSDAMPIVRMQADLQNEGYAAGLAAAAAAGEGKSPRAIDIRAVQRRLVEIGNLPAGVLEERDSFPPDRKRLERAVERAAGLAHADLAVILAADRSEAVELLRTAHERAAGVAKVATARILGVLGDAAGAATLGEALRAARWDAGENVEPWGNRGGNYSDIDLTVIALGLSRDESALAPLIEKLEQLDERSAYSHCRAVALALESVGDRAAAKPLADLLRKPGMTGHAIRSIGEARKVFGTGDLRSVKELNERLRELVLARALHRCGDWQDLGKKILEEYREDLCGHFARHADAILQAPRAQRQP
jgi:flavin-dependent dehydrogenase